MTGGGLARAGALVGGGVVGLTSTGAAGTAGAIGATGALARGGLIELTGMIGIVFLIAFTPRWRSGWP